MKREEIAELFDQQASQYDENWKNVAAIKDAMHLILSASLKTLSADARVLCVGVGTGQEVLYLANAFPKWTFTLVEPAPEMLKVCRENLAEQGLDSRCYFHEGFLETLPELPLHHGATSVLVSHFILDPGERSDYFREISNRLLPEGKLFNADLTADTQSPDYAELLNCWMSVLSETEMDEEQKQNILDTYERDVAILSPQKLAVVIENGGFVVPQTCFQAALIQAQIALGG